MVKHKESFATLYEMIDYYRQNINNLRDEKNTTIFESLTPILAPTPTLEK